MYRRRLGNISQKYRNGILLGRVCAIFFSLKVLVVELAIPLSCPAATRVQTDRCCVPSRRRQAKSRQPVSSPGKMLHVAFDTSFNDAVAVFFINLLMMSMDRYLWTRVVSQATGNHAET